MAYSQIRITKVRRLGLLGQPGQPKQAVWIGAFRAV